MTSPPLYEIVKSDQQANLDHLTAACPAVMYSSCPGAFDLTAVSQSVTSLFGYTDQDLLAEPTRWLSLIHPDDRSLVLATLSQGTLDIWQECEYRFFHKQLGYRWVQNIFQLVSKPTGPGLELIGCWLDRTEHLQHRLAQQQRDALLTAVAEASQYLLTGSHFNTAVTKALAVTGNAAQIDRLYVCELHTSKTGVLTPQLRYAWVKKTESASSLQLPWTVPADVIGQRRWYQSLVRRLPFSQLTRDFHEIERSHLKRADICSVFLLPIFIEDQLWGFMSFENRHIERQWSAPDISLLQTLVASLSGALKHHQKESELLHHAFHDPLTGLPNRALFTNRLEQSLKQLKRYPDYLFAVLFLDLDRFKIINDSMGHGVGDQLLMGIAERLLSSLRPGDTASRLGGDEFVILLNGLQNQEDASATAERLRQQLTLPFNLGVHEIFIDVSIGITLSNFGYQDSEQVLQDADVAMYQAKSAGKGCHKVFNTGMQSQTMARSQLETEMRRAIERQAFEIYYQPIVCLKTGAIDTFEALIRWYDSNHQPIAASDLIGIAEESGMIQDLGLSVLQQACNQLRQWQRLPDYETLRISVNLSAKQLFHSDLVTKVADILTASRIDPTHLKLELTESTIIRNDQTTITLLKQLRDLGLELYLDDFGAGYSSLSYLYSLPIKALKIDQTFVQRIDMGAEGQAIIRSILLLANNLDLKVVAEGVENKTQLNYLNSLDCTHGQGFLFAPPLTARGATSLLRSQDRFEYQSA
ncbi:EAL domain-containing protein [Acaryochloris sp. 'Moss Beach']|uniref:bifunctional diguanylate cyclase/phosphodiesterase n=1 Tax=Acaryochloris sp. 'Moss Beach' TaxID=2740837 RepID=UPI001F46A33C|nr:EAL domain-containing protein [Acaryochloris sp. 'Moss Beach']UJB69067.1 EAL domain-containing protein [Acaryochloris sp. 'Moss Beach']